MRESSIQDSTRAEFDITVSLFAVYISVHVRAWTDELRLLPPADFMPTLLTAWLSRTT